MKQLQIAVIGSAGLQEYRQGGFDFDQLYEMAYQVGWLLAQQWCIVVTGGKSGIMLWAAKWAKDSGWTTVGFIKWANRWESNAYTDVEIVTNMWDGGDGFMIPYSADAAIVIWGGVGTLKEISWFYLQGKPLIVLQWSWGWSDKLDGQYLDERQITKIVGVANPQDAVMRLLEFIGQLAP